MGKDDDMQETKSPKTATNGASEPGTVAEPAAATTFSSEQLALIRDEWVAPLLEEYRHQAQDIATLEVLYRRVVDERDRLLIERDELLAQLEAAPDDEQPAPQPIGRLVGLTNLLGTAEGAVVAGIAIAIALWVGIGLTMFIALG
jgi:hypothetical protein